MAKLREVWTRNTVEITWELDNGVDIGIEGNPKALNLVGNNWGIRGKAGRCGSLADTEGWRAFAHAILEAIGEEMSEPNG